MSTFIDTTKQDWGLTIAGVIAAVMFYWLYPGIHPFSEADYSFGESAVSETSGSILNDYGFEFYSEPLITYRTRSSLLDSIQTQTGLSEFLSDSENRLNYAPFYWEAYYLIEEPDPDEVFVGRGSNPHLTLSLSENGELLELQNPGMRIPARVLRADILNQAIDVDLATLSALPTDSTVLERMVFDFSSERFNENSDPAGRIVLTREDAIAIASAHLNASALSRTIFDVDSAEKVTVSGSDGARVTFRAAAAELRQKPVVSVTVLPPGTLISLEKSVDEQSAATFGWEQIQSGIQAGVLIIAVFWVLALLIIRFRMRLIDLKAAILVAVLAGFIIPLIFVLQALHDHFAYGGELGTRYLLGMLFMGGVIAAFMSVIYFLSTSISDSITRQHWANKLRSLDLIRLGYFVNKPVGLVFVRSVIYSFLIAGLLVLILIFMPERYITVRESFYSDGTYLPTVSLILSNLALFVIITQAIFLIGLGHLKSVFRSPLILCAIVVLIFALMNPLFLEVGPAPVKLLVPAVAGLAAALIYFRDDALTIFLTFFFTAGHFDTAPGWLIAGSPDQNLFYTHLLILAGSAGFGLFALRSGSTRRELPDFVPEYVEELAQDERIKQELQIARKVQQSFLPESTPDFEGLDIAAICKPAYETGGDYYDFIPLDNKRLAVVIGDVSGKGIQAAFYMTFTKGVLHTICQDFSGTREALTKTNNLFRKNARRGAFVSLIFGVADPEKGEFCFSRAGHNPLLHFDFSEKKLSEFTPKGIGVGMAEDQVFMENISEQTIRLESGDVLVMFTDGVVEATSTRNEFYGNERLQHLISTYHHLSSEELLDKLMEDLNSFSDQENPQDDMTMLVIKKK